MDTLLDDDGCVVLIARAAVENSSEIYTNLSQNIPWMSGLTQQIYGKTCGIPRALYFLGDENVDTYRYSRLSFPVAEWGEFTVVRDIRDLTQTMASEMGYDLVFDSCLLNYYRDGNEYIAWHGDKEVRCAHNAVVTVSLGATRRFLLRRKADGHKIELSLRSGDVVMMLGDTQQKWEHTIPVEKRVKDGRISLTYRLISR